VICLSPTMLVAVLASAAEPSRQAASVAIQNRFTASNGWPDRATYSNWTRSLGGPTSNRFSTLRQINRDNVAQLEQAWIYRSGDGNGNLQCNPIVVGDTMFASTSGHHVVALDAATGKERWRYFPERKGERLEHRPARRGLTYWPGDQSSPSRILFGAGFWVYALDPRTGVPLAGFGQNGRTELPTGAAVTGAVWNGVFVIPGFNRDVFGYDVRTGKMLWRFHTVPRKGEFGFDTWDSNGWAPNSSVDRNFGGANCWGGMALDESRGIAFLSTGSPKPNVLGLDHLGQNLFGNCVLALDVMTGRRIWHFQEIRHDIWDLDIPAPPNLVTVWREGRMIDAVAQVTKIGNTLLLDRCTGEPLFPITMRPAPASTLPGERAWP
jgi:quinoprotein glucose dehydrogenase